MKVGHSARPAEMLLVLVFLSADIDHPAPQLPEGITLRRGALKRCVTDPQTEHLWSFSATACPSSRV